MKNMRKVLVVSRIFPPSARVSGQRPLKLVRKLCDYDWEPIILTADEACMGTFDFSLTRQIEHLHIERTPCRSPWHHGKYWFMNKGLKRLFYMCVQVFARVTGRFVPLDSNYPWVFSSVKRGIALVKDLGIEVIWVTAPPDSSLELARRISAATGVPFIADFRDVRIEYSPENHQRLTAVLEQATAITHVSPAQLPTIQKSFPIMARRKHALIYNWFEDEERVGLEATPTQGFTILHGGTLYGGLRDTRAFVEALARFRQEEHIEFHQYGPKHTEHLLEQAKASNCEDAIKVLPSLERRPFLNACMGSSVLLVVVGHDHDGEQHAGAIPGKLFDYFLTDSPILVIGPADCVAGKIVSRYRRGFHVADDDVDGIYAALKQLKGDHGLDMSRDRIKDFSASEQVARLADLMNEVAAKGKKNRKAKKKR